MADRRRQKGKLLQSLQKRQGEKVQHPPNSQERKKLTLKKPLFKKKTKYMLIAAAAVILVAICGFLLIWFASGAHSYNVALAEGLEYYEQGDYENAIIAYKKAVEANPKSEEAVLGLARSYIEIKEYENARDVLIQAIARIGESDTLALFLEKLEYEYFDNGKAVSLSTSEIKSKSQNVSLNSKNWQSFGSLTYKEFKKQYKDAKTGSDGGTPTLTSASAQQILYYSNSESLNSSGKPMNNAYPSRIELTKLDAAFNNFDGAVSYEKLKSLFSGKIKKQKDNRLNCTAVYLTYLDHILVVACDSSGNIVSESAPNYLLPNCGAAKLCEVSGQVTDATTKEALEAELTFTPVSSGASSAKTVKSSASKGTYSIELNPGKYSIQVKAEEYIDTETTLTVGEDDLTLTKNFSLSPKLQEGEIRLVLEWGSAPKDLDCYLRDLNKNKTLVSYSHKTAEDSSGKIASLDVDVTNGFGPETITIYRISGNYELRINDYRHESASSVQNSGATVTVYMNGKSPQVISVPTNQSGNIWHVCRINNGVLTVINEMRSGSISSSN